MHEIRLLVVEDERIVSMDIQRRLKNLGYSVVATAVRGEEAIEKAGTYQPDLVLMDIMLEGDLDGIAAAETIRSRFHIPIIYLTAYADTYTLQRAKVTEPFGYILKPFEERELHGHIEIALYKHRMERRLRESEERYMLATKGANDGLWDWDIPAQKIYFSPRWKSMLGFDENDISEHPREWFTRLHPADSSQVKRQLAAHIKGQTAHFESEYRILCKDGSYRWMLTRGMALSKTPGRTIRIAGSQTDITDRKIYDPVTGLPNRTLFIDRIQTAVDRARRHDEWNFAVLSLNVNDFKTLADNLIYANRDGLLIQIARRFQEVLGPGSTLACLNEGNFGVLLDDAQNPNDMTNVALALQRALNGPFQRDGQELYLHLNIGIALGSTTYTEAEDLLRDASTAMHRAETSVSQVEIFDENMRSRVALRIKREADFRRAVERQEFEAYYQPIVSLSSGRIAGFEALVRWQHPEGLLLPGDFIPFAEQSGLILPMEKLVLRQVVRQMAAWRHQLPHGLPFSVSVNLSAGHYSDPDLVNEIQSLLEETNVDPRSLKLEITETTLMQNKDSVRRTLTELDELKVKLAMDDFGTGYSSLSYLHQFPIKAIKIDQCFVSKLGLQNESRKIVQTIVALGNTLGMDVTAEGVENARQLAELQSFECAYAQGYLFSRPLSATSAGALLSRDLFWLPEDGQPGEDNLETARLHLA